MRLSGLASSWAALLIHACAFLRPDGRLAMVLPAELLTVHYAEPVRRWLRSRFASVHLVLFDRLQFEDALERIVLVVAKGSGGCDSFGLHYLNDADDLGRSHVFDVLAAAPAGAGKWTDLLLPMADRLLFRVVKERHFTPLSTYGTTELGTVTGANGFFMLPEATRVEFGLAEHHEVTQTCPPGTRFLKGLSFTQGRWRDLRDAGEAVWMLCPGVDHDSPGLRSYTEHGEALGVHQRYKCRIRTPWWRPPRVSPPDLFFTYMSHRFPRLVRNSASVTFVNSMHGVQLRPSAPRPRDPRSPSWPSTRFDAGRGDLRPGVRRWCPQDGTAQGGHTSGARARTARGRVGIVPCREGHLGPATVSGPVERGGPAGRRRSAPPDDGSHPR